jgi:hypothetical protein
MVIWYLRSKNDWVSSPNWVHSSLTGRSQDRPLFYTLSIGASQGVPAFRKWFKGCGNRLARYGAQPAFNAIELLHRKVHAKALHLLELQAQGRKPEALARLGELHGLRDALIDQMKTLV